jgi:peptidoglycan/LPS O-acetylase OafA/YrhL
LVIDALRGFAALYVLVYHNILVPDTKLILPKLIAPILLKGGSGVTLFFIISAVTLCYTLQSHKHEHQTTFKFYIRRFFRIAPLFYGWLLISALWQFRNKITIFKWLVLSNAAFVFNFFPGKQWGIVPASWTLGIEMIFYLLFPLIFYFVSNLSRAIIFLCISIVVALLHYFLIQHLSLSFHVEKYVIYLSLFHQLPVFAVGVITYFIYKKLSQCTITSSKKWGTLLLLAGITGFIILPYFFQGPSIIFLYPMSIVYSFIAIGLFLYPYKIFVNRLSIFFGMISYSLYLNHPWIIYYSNRLYEFIYSNSGNNAISLVICISITLICVTSISYLTYRFIEKPGILFGKKIIKGIKAKTSVALVFSEVPAIKQYSEQ